MDHLPHRDRRRYIFKTSDHFLRQRRSLLLPFPPRWENFQCEKSRLGWSVKTPATSRRSLCEHTCAGQSCEPEERRFADSVTVELKLASQPDSRCIELREHAFKTTARKLRHMIPNFFLASELFPIFRDDSRHSSLRRSVIYSSRIFPRSCQFGKTYFHDVFENAE